MKLKPLQFNSKLKLKQRHSHSSRMLLLNQKLVAEWMIEKKVKVKVKVKVI
jgi:hypothetical protein